MGHVASSCSFLMAKSVAQGLCCKKETMLMWSLWDCAILWLLQNPMGHVISSCSTLMVKSVVIAKGDTIHLIPLALCSGAQELEGQINHVASQMSAFVAKWGSREWRFKVLNLPLNPRSVAIGKVISWSSKNGIQSHLSWDQCDFTESPHQNLAVYCRWIGSSLMLVSSRSWHYTTTIVFGEGTLPELREFNSIWHLTRITLWVIGLW